MKAFDDVKKHVNENPSILEWFNSFERANKIKIKMNDHYITYINKKTADNRMDRVWNFVKTKEHFPTFINGELTSKARYYLNGIKILMVYDKEFKSNHIS